jgi:fatty-acyl-CoA synthase
VSIAPLPGTFLRLRSEAQALWTVAASGMIGFERPDRLLALYQALDRFGAMAGVISAAAVRYGDRTGLIDERGRLSFAELDHRSNSVANALRARE